jgi:hypothetical protein
MKVKDIDIFWERNKNNINLDKKRYDGIKGDAHMIWAYWAESISNPKVLLDLFIEENENNLFNKKYEYLYGKLAILLKKQCDKYIFYTSPEFKKNYLTVKSNEYLCSR